MGGGTGETYEEVGPGVGEAEIPDGPPVGEPPVPQVPSPPVQKKPEEQEKELNPFFDTTTEVEKKKEQENQLKYLLPEVSAVGLEKNEQDSRFAPLRDDGINLDSEGLSTRLLAPKKSEKKEPNNSSSVVSAVETSNKKVETKQNKPLWLTVLIISSVMVTFCTLILVICLLCLTGTCFLPSLKPQ